MFVCPTVLFCHPCCFKEEQDWFYGLHCDPCKKVKLLLPEPRVQKKIRPLSQLEAGKNRVSPYTYLTDRKTDGWTDIHNYREASLLKILLTL